MTELDMESLQFLIDISLCLTIHNVKIPLFIQVKKRPDLKTPITNLEVEILVPTGYRLEGRGKIFIMDGVKV